MGVPSVETPQPPAQPTAGASMADYVQNLPKLYETQMQYAPQFAELSKSIAEGLYPTTAGLQEKLALMGEKGMSEDIPPEWRESYRSNMASMLGENAKSMIGADYMSTNLMQQNKQWQDYYTNLAMTMAGRQPLAQAPQGQEMQQGYSPGQVMGFNASTYSPYMSTYGSMYNTNAQMSQMNAMQPWMYMQGAGNALQGIGSLYGK